ncbi:MAG: hypothetical protein Q9200_006234, partial [Gallowayella weberi]
MRDLDWAAAPYYTVMMISRNLAIVNCFRTPLVSWMGRDALVVDIAVQDEAREENATKVLRLCTTHLESLWEERMRYLPTQLSSIGNLLKGASALGCTIVGGIVGGDMNAIDRSEHELCRAKDINLRDAWEDMPPPQGLRPKPGQKDLTYGRAKGNTWGYQSLNKKPRDRKRLDKVLYTGSIEPVVIDDIGDLSGVISRIGIQLETKAKVWERKHEELVVQRDRFVEKTITRIFSQSYAERLKEDYGNRQLNLVQKERNIWVSDHFGIAL